MYMIYLKCINNSLKYFFTPNMSTIGAFLTKSQKFGPRSNNLKNAPILLISGVMNFLMSCFHTPNMSTIGAFLTMSKILDPIFLTIRKNSIPNFLNVAINRLIYLKSGPKLSGNPRHIGFIFDWNVIFQMLTVLACLGLGPNYLTRTDHHRD